MSDEKLAEMEAVYKRALEREKKAREQAEQLLENRSRELYQANEELKENQVFLVQSEKMASLGQIAAGVAHEINNPVGFISSNLTTLTDYSEIFKTLLSQYEKLSEIIQEGKTSEAKNLLEEINKLQEEEDVSFLKEDTENILKESMEGLNRVKGIVENLKTFARIDEAEAKEININESIETTLKIVWNELKYKCEIKKNLGELPPVYAYAGQLGQVFMNLFVNAAHAMEKQGVLEITTALEGDWIAIKVEDTGKGIDSADLEKIFDPFFTTKEVGKGTGLGLSISHSIIEKHGGSIRVASERGVGTTFMIRLPVGGIAREATA